MQNLEERQREMRERYPRAGQEGQSSEMPPDANARKRKKPVARQISPPEREKSRDTAALNRRIADLEKQVEVLQAENERLRRQKTVYVERSSGHGDSVAEQRHNFFKYSNVRHY